MGSVEPMEYIEKERIAVEKVTLSDMKPFKSFPYRWDRQIKKSLQPHTHPYAYMEFGILNRGIVRRELSGINDLIKRSYQLSDSIPRSILIPIDQICFNPSERFSFRYTILICQPYTVDGKENIYPATLKFTNNEPTESLSVHGDFTYNKNGKIFSGNAYFWSSRIGYFFYFETVNDELLISKIEKSDARNSFDSYKTTIYKAKHILEWEAQREREKQDYEWLKQSLPEKCPKSLTGFRRMKTMNSKKYQALRVFALAHNKEI